MEQLVCCLMISKDNCVERAFALNFFIWILDGILNGSAKMESSEILAFFKGHW